MLVAVQLEHEGARYCA